MKQESRTKSKSSAIEQLLWTWTHNKEEDVISSFMASEADGRQSFTYFITSNFQQIHVYLMTPNRTDGSHALQTHGKVENRHTHTHTHQHTQTWHDTVTHTRRGKQRDLNVHTFLKRIDACIIKA